MLRIILQKEYSALVSDPRLRWSTAAVFMLFAVALATGFSYHKTATQHIVKAQEDTYRQWLEQGEKNPHSAAHYGLYAYKPVPLLAVFDRGMDDYLGNAVWLEAHNQNEVRLRPVQDAGSVGRLGLLTVGFVWQFILSLIIILISYDSVSRERESGTLRMLLSTEVSVHSLLLGKVLGLLKAVFLWLFLPMFLVLLGLMWLAGSSTELWDNLPALGSLFVFYGLFCTLFVVLGVLFSTRSQSSSMALSTLLGVWAVGAFLVPRISGSVARALHPTPSSFSFTEKVLEQREKGEDGQGSYQKFQQDLKEKTLRQYGVDSLSQLPVSFAGIALQASEDRDWKVYDQHYGALFKTSQQQEQVLNYFNLLSPVLAMRNVSRAFSETDLHKHLHFTKQAEMHRRLIAQRMNDDQTLNGIGQERGYKAGASLWQEVPQFQYQTQRWTQVMQHQGLGIATILLWLLVAVLLLRGSAQFLKP